MLDPVSITTTIITLATFIKDLIDLGQSIKRSIEKVGENRKRIRDLIEDILRTLGHLGELLQHQEDTLIAPHLLSALVNLKSDMLHVLSVAGEVCPSERSSGFRGFKFQLKGWLKRETVETEIRCLKEHVNTCYLKFTYPEGNKALSAARTEHTSLRVEQTLIANNVENQVRLRRLEGMMARVLVDTQFGQNMVDQTMEIILSDATHQALESQFLSVQVSRLVDLLKRLLSTSSDSMIETVDPAVPVGLVFPKPSSSLHLLHTILGMVLKITDNHLSISMKDIATAMLTLRYRFDGLGMQSEATNFAVLAVEFHRRLGSGEQFPGVLPRLSLALCHLSYQYQLQLKHDLALTTSQQAYNFCRVSAELSPEVDNHPILLLVSVVHSRNLRIGVNSRLGLRC
ncbi:hypothetical protein B0H17DRAFT_1271275 [Mycena rosella]|uniref:Fungal N-terminal domain-containing protein n=1 Tax=Mycena rosella TaxID=1033263 RepID=A0AAD7DR70_MYCRO|nr:hypothetical protein B0H17DRAFT_1271275 [Mycena rosella]